MKRIAIHPPFPVFLKEQISSYLHDAVYMILLTLTAVGSYGFFITHFSVSIDDLRYQYYYYGGLFAQGRFTGSLVERLFRLTDNLVWFQDFLGIVFLCFSAILLCSFFDSFYKTKNRVPQILFSCFLVSYPLHATLFCYSGCSLAFGVGLTMAAGALLLVKQFFETRKIKLLLFAVVLLVFTTSWYESVLILYMQTVLAALILYQIGTQRLKFTALVANGLLYVLPLFVAVAAEYLLSNLLMTVLKISPSAYTANQIFSLNFSDKTALFDQLNYIAIGNYLSALIRGLFFSPMILFAGAFLLLFVLGLVQGIRQKSFPLILTYWGLLALNAALPLMMGKVAPRTCQAFGFTAAFAAYLVYDLLSGGTRRPKILLSRVVLVGLACLLVGQTAQINKLFTADDLRYQQEKNLLTDIGNYMLAHDLDGKPVVFTGQVDLNDNIKSRVCVRKDNKAFQMLLRIPHLGTYCQGMADKRTDAYAFALQDDICVSLINCDLIFNKTLESEITLFFHYCGFDTIQYGTPQQQKSAQQYAADLPAWPRQGSCKDLGDFVVVNLGESTVSGF